MQVEQAHARRLRMGRQQVQDNNISIVAFESPAKNSKTNLINKDISLAVANATLHVKKNNNSASGATTYSLLLTELSNGSAKHNIG